MRDASRRVMSFGFSARLPEQSRRATWRYEFSDRFEEKISLEREKEKDNGGETGPGTAK